MQVLEDDEQDRYNKYTEDHPCQHPANGAGPNAPVAKRRSALCTHQRQQTYDKGKRGH